MVEKLVLDKFIEGKFVKVCTDFIFFVLKKLVKGKFIKSVPI